jgi:2-methylcitrate dehydratase PrpD
MDKQSRNWQALVDGWIDTPVLAASSADAAARLIADSLICGVAAAPLERSCALRDLLVEAGGAEEAWAAGAPRRLPATAAAAANAEAMNLLDADDSFLNISHFGALIVAVALAEGERTGADWGRVCRAVAAGFDLDARLILAARAEPGYFAPGLMMPGAAMAAAIAAGVSADEVRRAVGLSLRTAPAPATRQVSLAEITSYKYAPYAAIAEQAVKAARLAAQGYASPDDFLVATPGFLHAQRAQTIRWDFLAPSDDRWIERTSLKPFPSFRIGQPCVIAAAQAARGLSPDAIEKVELFLDPRARLLPFHHWRYPLEARAIERPIAASMSLRVSVACTLAGIAPGARWSARETLERSDVRELYDLILVAEEPVFPAADLESLRDPRTGFVHDAFGRAVVHAGDERREALVTELTGDPWVAGGEPDWDWLGVKESAFLGSTRIVDGVARLGPRDDVRALLAAL